MDNLSVIIGSCDAYNSLWKPFQICFDRYWKFDTKNYIVTEKMEVPLYTDTEFITVTSDGNTWAKRMLDGINKVDTDYIFFIMEDYFFNYTYDTPQMEKWLSDMSEFGMDRLQISPGGFQDYMKVNGVSYDKIKHSSKYLISMQPSIWRREFLLKTLHPSYDAWDFENKGSTFLKNKETNIFADRSIGRVYFNAVRRGFRKSNGWNDFMKNEGLDCNIDS